MKAASLMFLAVLSTVSAQVVSEPSRVGPHPVATGETPDHWQLTPAGLQVEIGDRPMGMAATPGGRYLIVSNNGQGVQSLALFDTYTDKVVQELPYASPEALFLGVAVSQDGSRVYASAGGNDKIRVYNLDEQGLHEQKPIMLDNNDEGDLFVAGLALSQDGRTLYAALNLDNSVAFIDTASGDIRQRVRLSPPASEEGIGVLPYQLALTPNGDKLYVSEWNGGGVSVVGTAQGERLGRVATGGHASDLLFSPDAERLYVTNANSDTVSVIDTATDQVTGTVNLAPYPDAPMGSMPNALAVSQDGGTLFVANGGNNDVAVVDTQSLEVRGLIPTAWFPSALALSSDGTRLYAANMKGLGAGPNPRGPNPALAETPPDEQYIGNMARGTLSVIPVPGADALARHTAQVVENNGFDETRQALTRPPEKTRARAVPRRAGDPTPIEHVIYVIKENRTYDQVLGDLPQGDGDPSLLLFGRDSAPNHHALAEEFVLFDNCYVSAEVSPDGHNWSVGAVATDYVQKTWPTGYSGRERSYDWEGGSSAPAPEGGYLWDYASRAGVSFRVYGEFTAAEPPNVEPAPFASVENALRGNVAPNFSGYDLEVTDMSRYRAWKAEFDGYVAEGEMPQLMIVRLPNDHTAGTSPGMPTPEAMMADNDLAMARLIEDVSNSPFWESTAVFIIEDDAQNGPDHVDAHRTVCYAVSPYTKRGFVDHTEYSTVSMLRTLELMLGLSPMTQFDAEATPMFAAFTDTPDLTPYTAIVPEQPLNEMNPADAYRAEDSLALDLEEEADQFTRADEQTFNQILWGAIKGPQVAMPTPINNFRTVATDPIQGALQLADED